MFDAGADFKSDSQRMKEATSGMQVSLLPSCVILTDSSQGDPWAPVAHTGKPLTCVVTPAVLKPCSSTPFEPTLGGPHPTRHCFSQNQMRDQSGNVDTPDFFDDGDGKFY